MDAESININSLHGITLDLEFRPYLADLFQKMK